MRKYLIILLTLCLSLMVVGCGETDDTWKIVPEADKLEYTDLYKDSKVHVIETKNIQGTNPTTEEYIFYPAKDGRVIVYHVRVITKSNLLEDETSEISACRAISIKDTTYNLIETAYNEVPDGNWKDILPNLDNAKSIEKSIKKMTR